MLSKNGNEHSRVDNGPNSGARDWGNASEGAANLGCGQMMAGSAVSNSTGNVAASNGTSSQSPAKAHMPNNQGARTPLTVGHRSVKCGADVVVGAGDNNTQQALPSGGGALPRSQASSEASKISHQDTRILEQALPSGDGTLV